MRRNVRNPEPSTNPEHYGALDVNMWYHATVAANAPSGESLELRLGVAATLFDPSTRDDASFEVCEDISVNGDLIAPSEVPAHLVFALAQLKSTALAGMLQRGLLPRAPIACDGEDEDGEDEDGDDSEGGDHDGEPLPPILGARIGAGRARWN